MSLIFHYQVTYYQTARRNRCNGVYVYNHSVWSSKILPSLIRTYPKEVQREGIVTFANLGPSKNMLRVRDCIHHACRSTDLEFIDVATIEVDDASVRNGRHLADQIQELEELCGEDILAGYGLHLKVTPYVFHTPVKKLTQDMAMVPLMMEEELAARKNLLLMLYNICPSISTPATFPLLKHPDEAEWAVHDDAHSMNAPRGFVRIAVDPLTCYRGFGSTGESVELDANDLQMMSESSADTAGDSIAPSKNTSVEGSNEVFEDAVHHPLVLISGIHPPQLEHNITQALNALCPDLQRYPRLEDKALLVGLSAGADAVVVEGNQSAKITKLGIKKDSIPDSNLTMNVFGKFMVPFSI